jgi:hypothetical protein
MEGGTREVNWLSDSDFLPKVVPNCRIMTYGYESKWFGSGSIKNTASEIAPRFLRSLYQKRQVNGASTKYFVQKLTYSVDLPGSPTDLHCTLFWRLGGDGGQHQLAFP